MNSGLTIALGGNPNIGKSTLFNLLTGKSQHVGNWPGKTVERVEGYLNYNGKIIKVVDLPGTYSLNTNSLEEIIARDFILYGKPDVVIAMADATNLERNLYLVLQIMELTPRLVLALNMMDAAFKRGIKINTKKLATYLGIPVVPITAATGEGLDSLLKVTIQVGKKNIVPAPRVNYGKQIEDYIQRLSNSSDFSAIKDLPKRWLTIKLLENDHEVLEKLKAAGYHKLLQQAAAYRTQIGPCYQTKITEALYNLAEKIAQEVITYSGNNQRNITEKIDNIVLHRFYSFPIIFIILGAVFTITLFGASPISELLEDFFAWLAKETKDILEYFQIPLWFTGPLVDGLIVGVGAVISVMLPTMAIFFIIFALLEDSGFIPRLAFIMDRPLKAVGSQGKHCISCLLAFGCSIPAVYSARIMTGSHRIMAIITSAMLPCNGRLGVMLALTGAFFGTWAPLVMTALIIISVAAMLLGTHLLRVTFLRTDNPGFVLELPPYRVPRLKEVIIRTLRKNILHVLIRASLMAAPMTVIIWFFSNLSVNFLTSTSITEYFADLLDPIGLFFGLDGKMLISALYALPAKEVVLGALAIVFGLASSLGGSDTLEGHLLAYWSGLQAFTFLVFFMLHLPCLYTTVVIFRETGSLKWVVLSMLLPLVMALTITWLVYRVGLLLGF